MSSLNFVWRNWSLKKFICPRSWHLQWPLNWYLSDSKAYMLNSYITVLQGADGVHMCTLYTVTFPVFLYINESKYNRFAYPLFTSILKVAYCISELNYILYTVFCTLLPLMIWLAGLYISMSISSLLFTTA